MLIASVIIHIIFFVIHNIFQKSYQLQHIEMIPRQTAMTPDVFFKNNFPGI